MPWPTLRAVLLALVLSGCGASAAPGEGESPPHPLRAGQHVDLRVGLTEWTILVSRELVPPGRLTLLVTNTGATEHDLVVRDGRGTWETADLRPGERTVLVVRAGPLETLRLWCSMPGHRAQGMHTTLTTS
jgi:hypothetical protein